LSSAVPLDLYTPLIEKDLPVFHHAIAMARKHIRHPLGKHYVVGPDAVAIREFCGEHGCVFVDEREVVGVSLGELRARYAPHGFDRAGWVFQQLLKLGLDRIVESEHCLVLDSDTILVQPVVFERDGRYILDYTDGYAEEYDPSLYRLLGNRMLQPYSFICHYMLFEKAKLRALHAAIEARIGAPWDRALADAIDYSSFFGLSEYELYANFVLAHYPEQYLKGYWFNRSIQLDSFEAVMREAEAFSGRLKSVSYHYYNRKRKTAAPDCAPTATDNSQGKQSDAVTGAS